MYTKSGAGAALVPRLKSGGCGCLSLRAGTILTGILTILYSVLAVGVGLAALQEQQSSRLMVVVVLLLHLATLLLSALLLVGAITERAWMLRPWVVLKCAHVCVLAALCVSAGVLRLRTTTATPRDQLLLTATEFLSILVWVYMLMVVSSFMRQLKERRDERRALTALDDTWYTA